MIRWCFVLSRGKSWDFVSALHQSLFSSISVTCCVSFAGGQLYRLFQIKTMSTNLFFFLVMTLFLWRYDQEQIRLDSNGVRIWQFTQESQSFMAESRIYSIIKYIQLQILQFQIQPINGIFWYFKWQYRWMSFFKVWVPWSWAHPEGRGGGCLLPAPTSHSG